MRAMILAAGLGTRLRPLTDELPKPLVWIGDEPAVAAAVRSLARGGLDGVVMNLFHLPEAFTRALLATLALPVTTLVEAGRILGTAGGVANARAAGLLGEGHDVLVWNGDIRAELDVAALGRAHERGGARATLAVSGRRAPGEGTVGLGADGRVVRLRGERRGVEVAGADFVGAQTISASLVERLPREGCLVGDVYVKLLLEGEALATFEHEGGFDDVGTPGAYLEANLAWLGARGSFVHEEARVTSGVVLERCVLLAGAEVTGAGTLREVVLWPGARAEAPLARAIVTPRARVAC
jgi:mannose-1-phosphate guanylyltransferase